MADGHMISGAGMLPDTSGRHVCGGDARDGMRQLDARIAMLDRSIGTLFRENASAVKLTGQLAGDVKEFRVKVTDLCRFRKDMVSLITRLTKAEERQRGLFDRVLALEAASTLLCKVDDLTPIKDAVKGLENSRSWAFKVLYGFCCSLVVAVIGYFAVVFKK